MSEGPAVEIQISTTSDLAALATALHSGQTHKMFAALCNPALTDDQVLFVASLIDFQQVDLTDLREVRPAVRHAVLMADPHAVIAAFGWSWFGDPLAVQREFLNLSFGHGYYGEALRGRDRDGDRLLAMVEADAAAPLHPQIWLAVPAALLYKLTTGNGDAGSQFQLGPLAAALGTSLGAAFGQDPARWTIFTALFAEFTGTVGELLDLTVLLSDEVIPPDIGQALVPLAG